MDRAGVEHWITAYESAWRSPGTARRWLTCSPLTSLHAASPWSVPVTGLSALGDFWEAERRGPDEGFTMHSEVLAVEADTAIVRVGVEYEHPPESWRDLWVVVFDGDGRCRRFEEWPFTPEQPNGH